MFVKFIANLLVRWKGWRNKILLQYIDISSSLAEFYLFFYPPIVILISNHPCHTHCFFMLFPFIIQTCFVRIIRNNNCRNRKYMQDYRISTQQVGEGIPYDMNDNDCLGLSKVSFVKELFVFNTRCYQGVRTIWIMVLRTV